MDGTALLELNASLKACTLYNGTIESINHTTSTCSVSIGPLGITPTNVPLHYYRDTLSWAPPAWYYSTVYCKGQSVFVVHNETANEFFVIGHVGKKYKPKCGLFAKVSLAGDVLYWDILQDKPAEGFFLVDNTEIPTDIPSIELRQEASINTKPECEPVLNNYVPTDITNKTIDLRYSGTQYNFSDPTAEYAALFQYIGCGTSIARCYSTYGVGLPDTGFVSNTVYERPLVYGLEPDLYKVLWNELNYNYFSEVVNHSISAFSVTSTYSNTDDVDFPISFETSFSASNTSSSILETNTSTVKSLEHNQLTGGHIFLNSRLLSLVTYEDNGPLIAYMASEPMNWLESDTCGYVYGFDSVHGWYQLFSRDINKVIPNRNSYVGTIPKFNSLQIPLDLCTLDISCSFDIDTEYTYSQAWTLTDVGDDTNITYTESSSLTGSCLISLSGNPDLYDIDPGHDPLTFPIAPTEHTLNASVSVSTSLAYTSPGTPPPECGNFTTDARGASSVDIDLIEAKTNSASVVSTESLSLLIISRHYSIHDIVATRAARTLDECRTGTASFMERPPITETVDHYANFTVSYVLGDISQMASPKFKLLTNLNTFLTDLCTTEVNTSGTMPDISVTLGLGKHTECITLE